MKGTTLGTNPNPLFEDGLGPVLEPVGGEFQPRLATVYPGGGAYPVRLCPFSPAAAGFSRLSRLCQDRDVDQTLFSF